MNRGRCAGMKTPGRKKSTATRAAIMQTPRRTRYSVEANQMTASHSVVRSPHFNLVWGFDAKTSVCRIAAVALHRVCANSSGFLEGRNQGQQGFGKYLHATRRGWQHRRVAGR